MICLFKSPELTKLLKTIGKESKESKAMKSLKLTQKRRLKDWDSLLSLQNLHSLLLTFLTSQNRCLAEKVRTRVNVQLINPI